MFLLLIPKIQNTDRPPQAGKYIKSSETLNHKIVRIIYKIELYISFNDRLFGMSR
jgi:hypothetical protein